MSDLTAHVVREDDLGGTWHVNRYPGLAVHHAGLPDGHLTRVDGIPLTTAARTVVAMVSAAATTALVTSGANREE